MAGLSIIIPVYNSAQILPQLAERLSVALPNCAKTYEVILVNDGSIDNSWDIICEQAAKFQWIKGINLMRNYGQHNALLCGIKAAAFDVTVTMDDDLQHAPEDIHKLIAKLNDGYDVIYGIPENRKHETWRNIASWLIYFLLRHITRIDNTCQPSAFRAFRTELRKAFIGYDSNYVYIDILLSWGSKNFSSVPVAHHARLSGTSNYNFRKLLVHAFNVITSFSRLPLQIASIIGFIFTVFGGIIFSYVIIRYLINGGTVPGFTFLAASIALFSGIQLFVLGIIGEYLARIHFRTMHSPSYVIRSTAGSAKGDSGE